MADDDHGGRAACPACKAISRVGGRRHASQSWKPLVAVIAALVGTGFAWQALFDRGGVPVVDTAPVPSNDAGVAPTIQSVPSPPRPANMNSARPKSAAGVGVSTSADVAANRDPSSVAPDRMAPGSTDSASPPQDPTTTESAPSDPPKPRDSQPAVTTNDSADTPAPAAMTAVDLMKRVEPSVVRLRVKIATGEEFGSGFVVGHDGSAVTSLALLKGAQSAKARLRDGTVADVKGILAMEPDRDLALIALDLPAAKSRPVAIAAQPPNVGDGVVAFGMPHDSALLFSEGVITQAKSAGKSVGETRGKTGQWIVTNAAYIPGTGGGPLLNMQGEVVAVNSLGRRELQDVQAGPGPVDLSLLVSRKAPSPTPLSPDLVSIGGNEKSTAAIDITGSPKARTLASTIDELTLELGSLKDDAKGRLPALIQLHLESSIRARHKLASQPGPGVGVIAAALTLDEQRKPEGRELLLELHCVVSELDKLGKPFSYVVFKERAICGRISDANLEKGTIPPAVSDSVKGICDRFVSSVKRLRKD